MINSSQVLKYLISNKLISHYLVLFQGYMNIFSSSILYDFITKIPIEAVMKYIPFRSRDFIICLLNIIRRTRQFLYNFLKETLFCRYLNRIKLITMLSLINYLSLPIFLLIYDIIALLKYITMQLLYVLLLWFAILG